MSRMAADKVSKAARKLDDATRCASILLATGDQELERKGPNGWQRVDIEGDP